MILEFDRSRYSSAYLFQCISEAQVQAAVLAELLRLGIRAYVDDAGAKSLRGRTAGAMLRKGATRAEIAQVMKGRTGGGGKGQPDIRGHLPGGRALHIECKAPEWRNWLPSLRLGAGTKLRRAAGKLSPAQRARLVAAHADGCVAGVCWSVKDLKIILPIEFGRRM